MVRERVHLPNTVELATSIGRPEGAGTDQLTGWKRGAIERPLMADLSRPSQHSMLLKRKCHRLPQQAAPDPKQTLDAWD